MDNKPQFQLPERNPQTHAAHRREVFWQITFPLLITLVLLLALMAGVIYAGAQGSGEVSRWADVSLIWIILPALIATLVFLAVLTGITYLVTKLLGVVPGYARLVQSYFTLAQVKARSLADKVVEPVFKLHSFKAGADSLRKHKEG